MCICTLSIVYRSSVCMSVCTVMYVCAVMYLLEYGSSACTVRTYVQSYVALGTLYVVPGTECTKYLVPSTPCIHTMKSNRFCCLYQNGQLQNK